MRRSTYEAVEIGWGEGEKGRRGGVGRCWRGERERERERVGKEGRMRGKGLLRLRGGCIGFHQNSGFNRMFCRVYVQAQLSTM